MLTGDVRTLLVYAVRAYFLLTSAGVVIARVVPSLRNAFIPYGKTLSRSSQSTWLLQWLTNITVPKSWFWHYYLLSVGMSGFWGAQIQLCCGGSQFFIFEWIGHLQTRTMVLWSIMFVQGCRRLYESLYVLRPSSAKMWIGHYLVGLAFYFAMSIAILVDESPTSRG